MKKQDILLLQQGIKNVANMFGDNVRFSYAIAKNDRLIAVEAEAINKALEATPEFQEYDAKRLELVKTFAKKGEEGEPLSENGSFILEDKEAWDKAFEEFKKPYEELLKKRDEQIEQYNALLQEETDIKLHMITEPDLPRTITPVQLAGILSMVE